MPDKATISHKIASIAACLLAISCSAEEDNKIERQAADGPAESELATPVSAGADAGWKLVWAEEFDGEAIDAASWNFVEDCWGGGNNERQCYTARASNAAIEDGKLVITARKEPFTGFALPEHLRASAADPNGQRTQSFTSARLTTKGKKSWRYGLFEVRARLPQGQGTWPAIWMLPEDDAYGSWAASGEIDILEAVNLGVDCESCEEGGENTILGTLHFGGQQPDNDMHSTEISYPAVIDSGFHTFGLIWSQDAFTWTVDGVPFASAEKGDWFSAGSQNPSAPFDRPFHLILNLAIGGGLSEKRALGGVDEIGFPKRLEVDWVRVWQCGADPVSDNGCDRVG